MGTNYYLRTNICEKCRRYDEVHVGKSSGGWTFSFHATDKIRSAEDWRVETMKGRIFDECGQEISWDEFWQMVKEKSTAASNHAKMYPGTHPWSYSFLDYEGNSMSEYEFS